MSSAVDSPIKCALWNPDAPSWLPSAEDVVRMRTGGPKPRPPTFLIPGPGGNNAAFVKCGYWPSMGEARTLDYIANAVNADENPVVRVPRVYYAFLHKDVGYIVMEHVGDADCTEADYPAILAATRRLLSIPSPTMIPGPLGGGAIDHRFFCDGRSAVIYPSVTKLQEHINRILAGAGYRARITFNPDEPLVTCFDDLHYGNFRRDANGAIYSVDHGGTNFLPAAFQYLSFLTAKAPARRLAADLGYHSQDCRDLGPLADAQWQLCLYNTNALGLQSALKSKIGSQNLRA